MKSGKIIIWNRKRAQPKTRSQDKVEGKWVGQFDIVENKSGQIQSK